MKMRIIIGCNKSGREAIAFLARGHDVYTCDILPAEWKHKSKINGADNLDIIAS
ncbi:unnamed protein product, partial [marine sediment metagenome]